MLNQESRIKIGTLRVINRSSIESSSSVVRHSRRRQVGSCGVSVSGVKCWISIGAEGTLAMLVGPKMASVLKVQLSDQ